MRKNKVSGGLYYEIGDHIRVTKDMPASEWGIGRIITLHNPAAMTCEFPEGKTGYLFYNEVTYVEPPVCDNTQHGRKGGVRMNQNIVDMLKAEVIILEARRKAVLCYVSNTALTIEARCLWDQIDRLEKLINKQSR